MIALGLLLLILGLFLSHTLFVIGVILLIIGIVLNLVPIGGSRRTWY